MFVCLLSTIYKCIEDLFSWEIYLFDCTTIRKENVWNALYCSINYSSTTIRIKYAIDTALHAAWFISKIFVIVNGKGFFPNQIINVIHCFFMNNIIKWYKSIFLTSATNSSNERSIKDRMLSSILLNSHFIGWIRGIEKHWPVLKISTVAFYSKPFHAKGKSLRNNLHSTLLLWMYFF